MNETTFFYKIVDYFSKKLHLRCFVGFWLRLCSILLLLHNSRSYLLIIIAQKMKFSIRDDAHMTSMKIVQFSRPPIPPCPSTSKIPLFSVPRWRHTHALLTWKIYGAIMETTWNECFTKSIRKSRSREAFLWHYGFFREAFLWHYG